MMGVLYTLCVRTETPQPLVDHLTGLSERRQGHLAGTEPLARLGEELAHVY